MRFEERSYAAEESHPDRVRASRLFYPMWPKPGFDSNQIRVNPCLGGDSNRVAHTMSNILADDLIGYIHDSFGVAFAELDRETPLFSSGMLDSFSLVDIVSFVEDRTGLKVKPGEIQLANFDSVARISDFVIQKLSVHP